MLVADALLLDPGTRHIAELTELLTSAGQTVEEVSDETGGAHVRVARGRLQLLLGDLDGAGRLLDQAAETFRRRPDESGELAAAIGRASLQFAQGQRDRARIILGGKLQECIDGDFPDGRPRLLQYWALIDPEGCPQGAVDPLV